MDPYDSGSESGMLGGEWLPWCWNWKLNVPFNLANLLSLFHPCSVKKMLFPFQRAVHLVHCWEQSGPSCKTPARQVLHRQHLHHTECMYSYLCANRPLQVWNCVARCQFTLLEFTCSVFSQTAELKSGFRRHDVHYWVGEESKEVCALESWILDASTMVPQIKAFALLCLFLVMTLFVSSALGCGSGHLGRLSHGLRQGCWVGRRTGLQHGPVQGDTGRRIWQVLVILQTVCHPSTRLLLFAPERI